MKYTEEFKLKIVLEYVNTDNYLKNVTKLAKKYKIGKKSVSDWIKNAGYLIYNTSHHTSINEHIFDVIDTEEKAYWLGFIFADGCIHSNTDRFELSLAIKDYHHLEKFVSFLDCKRKNVIRSKKSFKNGKMNPQCRVSFRSKILWDSLNLLGCVPKKTLILKFPNLKKFSSSDLIKHFMRGYVDGDGCIYLYRKKNYPCLLCLGTKEFLEEFVQLLPISYKESKKIHHPARYQNTWSVHIWKEALLCLHFLYKDSSIYLDRKYQKYLEICRLCK